MHYLVAGLLKPGAEEQLVDYSEQLNEQLGANGGNLRFAGALRNSEGQRVGYLAIMGGENIDVARDWLDQSPFYKADLYERVDVFEYDIEVGQID